MNPEWVGYAAAVLTTAAYVPQMIKILRHRHTQSISLGMYVLITAGLALWFVYGVMIGSPSIMLANSLTCTIAFIILIMKIKYG